MTESGTNQDLKHRDSISNMSSKTGIVLALAYFIIHSFSHQDANEATSKALSRGVLDAHLDMHQLSSPIYVSCVVLQIMLAPPFLSVLVHYKNVVFLESSCKEKRDRTTTISPCQSAS